MLLLLAWTQGQAWHVLAAQKEATPGAGGAVARIESLDPLQTEQERMRRQMESRPQGYRDRFMDSVALEMEDNAREQVRELRMREGLGLRTHGLETRYGTSRYDAARMPSSSTSEWGQRLHFTQQTVNWGEWGVQLEGRLRHGDDRFSGGGLQAYPVRLSSARVTLRNVGLPVTQGVFADTTLGDLYSETTSALQRNYRLYLGSSVVRGLASRIHGPDFDVSVGMGERGRLIGAPYPGFESHGGSLAWFGVSRRFGHGRFAGLQFSQASRVPRHLYSSHPGAWSSDAWHATESVSSVAAAVGSHSELVREGEWRWRVTGLHSRTSATVPGRGNGAKGLFLEAGMRLAGLRHEVGAYHADANLRFGDNLIASDNQGGYWRVDGNSARLSWGLGLDLIQYNPSRAIQRPSANRWGLYGNAQYRIHRNDLVGVSGYWNSQRRRHAPGHSGQEISGGQRSVQASAFYQSRFFGFAPTRLRLNVWRNEELVVNDRAATGEEVQWEQEWVTGKYETQRPELTSTLGWARDRNRENPQTYPTAGVMARYWLNGNWSLGATLRYTSRRSHLYTSRGLSGSINSEMELGHGWHMGLSITLNQARMLAQHVAGLSTSQLSRSNDKSAHIYLRWSRTSGEALRGIGTAESGSAGAGSVRGLVFMDANHDGEQQAGETGVAQVEVILDGRYHTLTDTSGQFEFPVVATGSHRLTMRAESVPLPWGPGEGSVSVSVPLRGVAHVSLPVQRVGGGR